MKLFPISFFILISIALGCQKQNNTIHIEANQWLEDTTLKWILLPQNPEHNLQLNLNDSIQFKNGLNWRVIKKLPENAYRIRNPKEDYTLFCSTIPIIHINTNQTPIHKEYSNATLRIHHNTQIENLHCKIRTKGASSLIYPKKSYRLELYQDSTFTKTRKYPMLSLPKDDDWNLLAMYNEPLRLNNHSAHQIWNLISETKHIQTTHTEVFLNNNYMGIYLLTGHLSKKTLELDKQPKNQSILLKGKEWGKTTFDQPLNQPPDKWGFELKHPKNNPNEFKKLESLMDFVLNTNDNSFFNDFNHWLDTTNISNLTLFLNLLCADDNRGKNLYLYRKNNRSPWLFSPWDLDAIAGQRWDGIYVFNTNHFIRNGIIDRTLINNPKNPFPKLNNANWKRIKHTLNPKTITSITLKPYLLLLNNGAYAREKSRYAEFNYSAYDLLNLLEWASKRWEFMNNTFTQNTPSQPH